MKCQNGEENFIADYLIIDFEIIIAANQYQKVVKGGVAIQISF